MADTKLTDLTAITSPALTDLVYIGADPGGTPASKKCTLANLRAAIAPPMAISTSVYRTSSQTIANDSETLIIFNAENWDNDTIHDNSTNSGRLTCKTAGVYVVTANLRWDTNSTNARQLRIKKTSGATVTVEGAIKYTGSAYTPQSVTAIVSLAVDDYVEVYAYQDSGGNLAVIYSSDEPPTFAMVRIGTVS